MTQHTAATISRGVWSKEEHDLFLEALQIFPNGPWKAVAEHVGTRSVRQVQTHAQKYHEKVARRLRGLRKDRKRLQRPEHRIDDEMLEICQVLKRDRVPLSPRSANADSTRLPTLASTPPASSQSPVSSRVFKLERDSKDVKTSAFPRENDTKPECDIKQELQHEEGDPMDVPSSSSGAEHKPNSPSFNECIDYLIEILSSSEFGAMAWYSSDSDSDSV